MRPSHYNSRYKDHLTPRQRQVADLLTRGKTNSEIAAELGLGWETVKSHVSEVLAKLGVDTREEAAAYWRHERSAGAIVGRALRGVFGFAGARWVRITAAGGAVGAVAVVAALIAIAISRPDPVREAPPAAVTPNTHTVARLSKIPTCCVMHQVTVAGDEALVVAGLNVTNWQSQLYRAVAGSTALQRIDLGIWPLVATGRENTLWVSHPEAYDFDNGLSREDNRNIPGKPGDLSRIEAIDLATLARRESFVAPGRVDQLVVDDRSVWAISVLDNLVFQFDAGSGTEVHRLELEGIGEATLAGSHLWLTLPKLGEAVRVNGDTGAIDARARLPGDCLCGTKLASAGGAVWVSLFRRNSLARIDASDPARVVEVPLEAGPSEIASASDGSLWVALSSLDGVLLVQIDPGTGTVLARIELGLFEGTTDAMAVTSSEVWVTGQKGEVVRVSR